MIPLLLLFAGCARLDVGPDEPSARRPVEGGPAGVGVPTNVVPWAFFPGEPAPAAGEVRSMRLVDANGREVRAERVITALADGTRVQVVPNAPLAASREYKLIVPGALIKSFRTDGAADGTAPTGGAVRDWGWEGGACPTLTIGYAPVVDTGTIAWEIEAVRSGRDAAPVRFVSMVPAAAVAAAPPLKLRGCEGRVLPRAPLEVRLRWVDLAGNATPWSAPALVPAQLEYGAGSLSGGISSAP